MSEIADFLRERYTKAREAEAGRRSITGNFPYEWQWRREFDEEWIQVGNARVEVDAFFEQYGEPAADPAVLADLDAKLALVDDLLAERHEVIEDPWYTCAAATDEHDGGRCCDQNRRGKPCDCGRDERVNRRLAILAQPFAGHLDHKGEEWAP